jgi:multidrug efflux pump subunit AcrA (membrane-fusion protein)
LVAGCERESVPPAPPAPAVNVQTVRPHRGEITRRVALPGNVRAFKGDELRVRTQT